MSDDRPNQASRKRATIREVAERAGVATMTVSRVLNRSGYVSDAVRNRVLAAVDEVGYLPNQVARSLRSKRTGTIALVMTDVTNPFFTTVARGVEDAASDAGILVLLCNTDESEEEELRYMRMLLEKRVDGILLVPARTGEASIALARRHGIPVVVLDRRVPDASVDVVRCDPVPGSAELARLLHTNGHRRFAILAGPSGTSTSDDRVAGFLGALAGEEGVETVVMHGHLDQDSGRQMVGQALALDPRPTAIFAANNFITIGAIQELMRQEIPVPEEIALVGFDDLPPTMVTFPFLTVVAQPAYEMGHRGVGRLLRRLDAPEEPVSGEDLLPTEVVIRRSSGESR